MNTKFEKGAERFRQILSEIAAETPAARRQRWQGHFELLSGCSGDRLVLFGSGHLGRMVLSRLRNAGIEPCCFSDNNPDHWGRQVNGLLVLSPEEVVRKHGQTAIFVVTIFNGSAARRQLRDMGCKFVLPVVALFWNYPGEFKSDFGDFSPELIVKEEGQIRRCFDLLSDEPSRHEFCDQLEWRYWITPEFLSTPADTGEIYFPSDLVEEFKDEVFTDCGAFDGDSLRSFLRRDQTFRHLYALEPDPTNRERLLASLLSLPKEVREKITVWPFAVGDKDQQISFSESHGAASKLSSSDEGIAVELRRIDSLQWQFRPTYVKMDIEGSEPLALAGGAELFKTETPVLAVCLYHRPEHLWQIPNQIHSIVPEYKIYLRRYAEDCWEQVCYAVPPDRSTTK